MACEKEFFEQLRERGFRLTPQREMVLSVMHQIEGFATADHIHARVRKLSASVDISTIYRTLELLQDLQMVTWVDTGDGLRRYELLGLRGPHLHLVCRSCGKLVGVASEQVEAFANHISEAFGFESELDDVMIPGSCRECLQGEEREPVPDRRAG